MPDQNNPTDVGSTPTQVNPTSEPTQMPPIPPAQMDIPAGDASTPPPFPPEVSPPEGTTPPPDSGSAAPSFDIPPVITPNQPSKKFGGKRVIATILGLLVLVGGLGAGLILVRQQQDIREKAAGACTVSGKSGTCTTSSQCDTSRNNYTGDTECGKGRGCCVPKAYCSRFNQDNCINGCEPTDTGGKCKSATTNKQVACQYCSESVNACFTAASPPNCEPKLNTCETDADCSGGSKSIPAPTPYCTRKNQDDCINGCEPTNTGGECKSAPQAPPGGAFGEVCESKGGKCVSQELAASNSITVNGQRVEGYLSCVQAGGGLGAQDCPANEVCVKCEGTSTTPTTPDTSGGGPTAQCLNIKAFDTNWTQLTTQDLSALKLGDVVRFTVAGQTSSGSFDKARFKINGVQRPEVTGKRPGTEEYYDEYTIPEGITTFTINAQIHHATLGWSN